MPHHEITYFVNGDPQKTDQHKLTVRQILVNADFEPPENYVLERDADKHKFDNLNEEVPIREGERFTALFVGPTPVS